MSLPTHDPVRLLELGERLRPAARRGRADHRLRLPHPRAAVPDDFRIDAAAPGWSTDFDAWAAEALARGDVDELAAYQRQAPGMPYAHPTVEHYTPLFVTLGAATDPESPACRSSTASGWGSRSGRCRLPDALRRPLLTQPPVISSMRSITAGQWGWDGSVAGRPALCPQPRVERYELARDGHDSLDAPQVARRWRPRDRDLVARPATAVTSTRLRLSWARGSSSPAAAGSTSTASRGGRWTRDRAALQPQHAGPARAPDSAASSRPRLGAHEHGLEVLHPPRSAHARSRACGSTTAWTRYGVKHRRTRASSRHRSSAIDGSILDLARTAVDMLESTVSRTASSPATRPCVGA